MLRHNINDTKIIHEHELCKSQKTKTLYILGHSILFLMKSECDAIDTKHISSVLSDFLVELY